ncbi:MAG: class 1 fructose-bisphosphatase [Bacteroidota bacterium]
MAPKVSRLMTLERHIIEGEHQHPEATGEFTALLSDLALAAKLVWREVTKAGLVDILGTTGRTNIQGEVVKKLDAFADETIYKMMDHGGHLCVMASEEHEDILQIPPQYPKGKYVLLYDPLDGSANIDANITIGTIFGIHRRISPAGDGTMEDCLQPGKKMVAAGYILYGSSTMFVYSTGGGVHGFTLDPSVGEFILSHENMMMPKKGNTYSVNEGNWHKWDDTVKRFVRYLKEYDPATGRPYSLRYIGTLVADFHRTLLYGGIFMYPPDKEHPEGKLRLNYEAAPLAFIAEQAGGAASNGTKRILDIAPKQLHQRTPLFIGSSEEVALAEKFVSAASAGPER